MLKSYKSEGKTNLEISELMGRTVESIKTKWKRINYIPKATVTWSQGDLNLINSGLNLGELCEKLPHHSRRAIQSKKELIGNFDDYRNWSDEDLINIVKKYSDKNLLNKYRLAGEPSAGVIERRFGNWSLAKKSAGMDVDKIFRPTMLYLVDFGDFKKVGITQEGLEKRFNQFPKYTLLDYVWVPTRIEALELEQAILKNVNKINEKLLPNGNTECFYSICTLLEDLT